MEACTGGTWHLPAPVTLLPITNHKGEPQPPPLSNKKKQQNLQHTMALQLPIPTPLGGPKDLQKPPQTRRGQVQPENRVQDGETSSNPSHVSSSTGNFAGTIVAVTSSKPTPTSSHKHAVLLHGHAPQIPSCCPPLPSSSPPGAEILDMQR